jgi:hypothetical protein
MFGFWVRAQSSLFVPALGRAALWVITYFFSSRFKETKSHKAK